MKWVFWWSSFVCNKFHKNCLKFLVRQMESMENDTLYIGNYNYLGAQHNFWTQFIRVSEKHYSCSKHQATFLSYYKHLWRSYTWFWHNLSVVLLAKWKWPLVGLPPKGIVAIYGIKYTTERLVMYNSEAFNVRPWCSGLSLLRCLIIQNAAYYDTRSISKLLQSIRNLYWIFR